MVDYEGRTVELNSPVGSVPYIKPNYLLQFEFILTQTITENSQLILVGPDASRLDVSFFHMFYNGTTIYIGADAIGSNMFADQSPFYFNINLELNQWYKLVCSQVTDDLTAVLFNFFEEPWSFGAGIYTSMIQMFDQDGTQVFMKVNIKDMVCTIVCYTVVVIFKV